MELKTVIWISIAVYSALPFVLYFLYRWMKKDFIEWSEEKLREMEEEFDGEFVMEIKDDEESDNR